MPRTPWIGLAALLAMFVIPFLPDWLFEGPRTVKHWPRRHVCGDCNAPWTDAHICAPPASKAGPRLRGDLRRVKPTADLEHLPGSGVSRSKGQGAVPRSRSGVRGLERWRDSSRTS